MHRFALQFAKFFVLQAVVAGGLFLVCWTVHPPSESYLAAARDKRRLLLTQPNPRLVIVGDSSAAFGLDSGLMARHVARQPVNLGLMAGLELSWNLRSAEVGLRSGDVVLVHFFPVKWVQDQPNGDFLLRLVVADPSTLASWTSADFKEVLDRGAHAYWTTVARVGLGILFRPRATPAEGNRSVMWRVNFNAAGDMIGHAGLPTRWNPERTPTFQFNPLRAESPVQTLRGFGDRCRGRGIRVFLVTPPLPKRYWELSKTDIERQHHWIVAHTGIPRLNEPKANVWPDGEFFDGPGHPSRPLAIRHSEIIGDQLLRALTSDVAK